MILSSSYNDLQKEVSAQKSIVHTEWMISMDRSKFLELAKKQILYLDGACGSNLVKAGMPAGVCPEKWILEHRDIMLALAVDYVKAGTDILYAPTFTANRKKLSEYGLEDKLDEYNRELVAISKEAAAKSGRTVYVAGDLSMLGEALKPIGNMELEEMIAIYKEQITALVKAGVDLLIIETMMSLAETRAAVIAAKEVCDLPIMATLTFERDGRTLYGTDATTAAVVLEALGVCAIGANCSSGPAQMKSIIEQMKTVTRIPVIAKPNAGLPMLNEAGETVYSMDEAAFAEELEELLHTGATILGGCCGTTPKYIASITERFGRELPTIMASRPEGRRYLTSERQTLAFDTQGNFIVVGERINPTGKKQLQAELREGSLELVLRYAEEQEKCGAQILDVNMGMGGIDEKEMMLRALEEISGVTNLPLSIDSSHGDVLEAALRQYPGRALINSISLETEKLTKMIPIAAKYGAMFILLPLSDKGLPENLEEKKEIIQKIVDYAISHGMSPEDIIVDGLVTTVGANKRAAIETLETIRYCKEKGFATICGLSNISFGMPERSYVNASFLTLAIQEGLTMAIANPSQELLMSMAFATDLLLDKEDAAIRYIEYVGQHKDAEASKTATPAEAITIDKKLYSAILKGNRKEAAKLAEEAIQSQISAEELLNEVLLPAINEVGALFESGKYFLPQLIAGAESMKNAIEIIEPLFQREENRVDMPVVVIATVEGDIHDIGKNLVALMLKNYGFQVIDLGKDVPADRIIQTAKENKAKIIALSALMTTTMQRMMDVIQRVQEEQLSVKVMVGGAVVTEEYAKAIGADGYSKDAADAVKLAKSLI